MTRTANRPRRRPQHQARCPLARDDTMSGRRCASACSRYSCHRLAELARPAVEHGQARAGADGCLSGRARRHAENAELRQSRLRGGGRKRRWCASCRRGSLLGACGGRIYHSNWRRDLLGRRGDGRQDLSRFAEHAEGRDGMDACAGIQGGASREAAQAIALSWLNERLNTRPPSPPRGLAHIAKYSGLRPPSPPREPFFRPAPELPSGYDLPGSTSLLESRLNPRHNPFSNGFKRQPGLQGQAAPRENQA